MKTFCLVVGFMIALVASDYTGSWSYSVTGPDGVTYKGDLVLTTESGEYKAELQTDGLVIPCKDLEIAGDEISFYIMLQGMQVDFNGTFEGNSLSAIAGVEGMEIPFKATKKD